MKNYDAIVIGAGGIGSAAVFHLVRHGLRVLGLDRFTAAHDRGSSHGQTRIIRQAYCEHPDYVPLVQRSVDLWRELEVRRNQQLYHEIGILEVGPPDGMVVKGALDSARQHGLEIETLQTQDVAERFPGFSLPEGASALFERRAGYLLVEQCILAHLDEAKEAGADLEFESPVRGWRAENGHVVIETDRERYQAERLVITAGPWARELLKTLGIRLEVLRKPLHWFAAEDSGYRKDQGCPVFLFELATSEIFYGFPQIDDKGVKVAAHHGGKPVIDPVNLSQEVDVEELAAVERFLTRHLPGVSQPARAHAACMYTMSPDHHFIVDRHPEHPQVAFAAGLSGHGFKFSTVLGEALADLGVTGTTSLPIEFLNSRRPGLRHSEDAGPSSGSAGGSPVIPGDH